MTLEKTTASSTSIPKNSKDVLGQILDVLGKQLDRAEKKVKSQGIDPALHDWSSESSRGRDASLCRYREAERATGRAISYSQHTQENHGRQYLTIEHLPYILRQDLQTSSNTVKHWN